MIFWICSDEQGTARSGCDDGFGVFGFLAFLLALLDLLLDLGGEKRSLSTFNQYHLSTLSGLRNVIKTWTNSIFLVFRKKRSAEGMCEVPNHHPQVEYPDFIHLCLSSLTACKRWGRAPWPPSPCSVASSTPLSPSRRPTARSCTFLIQTWSQLGLWCRNALLWRCAKQLQRQLGEERLDNFDFSPKFHPLYMQTLIGPPNVSHVDQVGRVVAQVAGANAASWLSKAAGVNYTSKVKPE